MTIEKIKIWVSLGWVGVRRTRLVVLMTIGMILSGAARAKTPFFVEPYVGIGKLELDFGGGSLGTFKEVANGFYLGGKLGFGLGNKFFIGGDYHVAGPFQFDESLGDAEWNHKMMGVGLGADYKVIRFWAGYYFTSAFEDAKADVDYTGTAIKVGFGLLATKNVRANLELVFFDVEKMEYGGSSTDISGSFSAESTHVSISVPLSL